jgi:phosphotransacetylase
MYTTIDDLIKSRLLKNAPTKKVVIAGGNDEHVLQAVFAAQEQYGVSPVLAGDAVAIQTLLEVLGYAAKPYEIAPCQAGENPSSTAVRLVHAGTGDFIVKGRLESKDFLRPILDKETGLNRRRFVTHFGIMKLHNYHKMLAISDCAVIPYPTLEDKKKIIEIGVSILHKIGYKTPVVGVLCAVETVNDKMPETIDAQKLQQMGRDGEFGDCVVLGPISYDLATSKESAKIKGYASQYAGDVDFLLVPQLVTGNVMSKIWNIDPRNKLAGCLVGADTPIVLTSRSASAEEKLNSILLSAAIS